MFKRIRTPRLATSIDVEQGTKRTPLTSAFLLAGKAVFEVSNGVERFRFKVRKQVSTYKGERRISFWLGVRAESPRVRYGYALVGVLNPETGTVKCVAGSQFLPGSKEYDIAAWACQVIIRRRTLAERYTIEHVKRCGRCAQPTAREDGLCERHGMG